MIKLILSFLAAAVLVTTACLVIDRAQSGADTIAQLRNFHHWTVQAHWTNPVSRTVRVLLDEESVTGTDSKCEAVLDMLDKLTSIVPAWNIELISPTGWMPVRWNPIDRQGVEAMLKDTAEALDEEDERRFERMPPPAYKTTFRTETSH
uniref:Uncharacterized protein n=1 Tax=viral metagenome TaxID=1070528 RepID=A0A6M3KVI7_9ZZZZ